MADRFSELLAKQKAGQLSAKEAAELAQLLYQGQLPPSPVSALGFVSKHRMAVTDMAARLRAIKWFANCGEPRDFDLTPELERVSSWSEAVKSLKSPSREDAWLDARNQLSDFLSKHCPERFRNWNKTTVQVDSEIVRPLKETVWEPFRKANKLDVKLVHATEWSILVALMENAYMDCNHNCFFFLELLPVYEAGHVPCGWHGEWPEGKLVVF